MMGNLLLLASAWSTESFNNGMHREKAVLKKTQ